MPASASRREPRRHSLPPARRCVMQNRFPGKSFPLVVVSHGYPGSRTFLTYLTENLASKGYVVAAIDHTDSVWGDIKPFPSTLFNRSSDQLFTIRALTEQASKPGNFLQRSSRSRQCRDRRLLHGWIRCSDQRRRRLQQELDPGEGTSGRILGRAAGWFTEVCGARPPQPEGGCRHLSLGRAAAIQQLGCRRTGGHPHSVALHRRRPGRYLRL